MTEPIGTPDQRLRVFVSSTLLELEGTAQYRIGDKTMTVHAPYVAKVPAGMPHTFINAGSTPFNLIAVFPSKHPGSKRIGPNPLIRAPNDEEKPRSSFLP